MVSGAIGNLTWSTYAGFCGWSISYSIHLSRAAWFYPRGGGRGIPKRGVPAQESHNPMAVSPASHHFYFTNHICRHLHHRWQTTRLSDRPPHIRPGLAGCCPRAYRPAADALPRRAGIRWRGRYVRGRGRHQRHLPLRGAGFGHRLLLCREFVLIG